MAGLTVWEFRKFVRMNRESMPARCPLGTCTNHPRPCAGEASRVLGLSLEYCAAVTTGFDGQDNFLSFDAKGFRYGRRMRLVTGYNG